MIEGTYCIFILVLSKETNIPQEFAILNLPPVVVKNVVKPGVAKDSGIACR